MKWSHYLNCFLAGILCGYLLFGWNLFQIKYEIDLVAVAGIIATLFLAVYITDTISKKNTENRIEKDLVIKKVFELEESYLEIYKLFKSNQLQVIAISGLTDGIATKVTYISNLMKTCGFIENVKNITDLILIEKVFRDLLTNAKAENDSFVYEEAKKIAIAENYTSITELCTGLIVQLNRV